MRRVQELTRRDAFGTPVATNPRRTFALIGYSEFATVSADMSNIYTRPDVFSIGFTLFSQPELFRTRMFVEEEISALQAARGMKNRRR